MPTGELAYLSMVITGFVVFAIVLASLSADYHRHRE